jgi:hypothetical protein
MSGIAQTRRIERADGAVAELNASAVLDQKIGSACKEKEQESKIRKRTIDARRQPRATFGTNDEVGGGNAEAVKAIVSNLKQENKTI